MFRTILVAFDGSPGATKALRTALLLARESDATLRVLSVADPGPRFAATVGEMDKEREAAEAHYAALLDEARRLAAEQGIAIATAVMHWHAAKAIVDEADRGGHDLLVMGHSGHSGVWGLFLGTTTDEVGRHAPCSVLIFRQEEGL